MFPIYPQSLYCKFVKANIKNQSFSNVVDCPCGRGYTTQQFAEMLPAAKVKGVDIDTDYLDEANNYKADNLSFEQNDIHSFLESTTPFDLFLLINSIFLLPDPEGIMNKIHKKLSADGKMIIIIPNIDSVNFKNFQQAEPGVNKLVLTKDQAIAYFQKHGFKVEKVDGIAYVPYIGKTTLSKMGRFKGFYTYGFNVLNRMMNRQPCYWGFVLSK